MRVMAWLLFAVAAVALHGRSAWIGAFDAFGMPADPGVHTVWFWARNSIAFAWTGAFWLAMLATGGRVTGMLRVTRLNMMELLPVTLLLGFAVYACIAVSLGLVGLLFPVIAAPLALGLAASGLPAAIAIRRRGLALRLAGLRGVFGGAALVIGLTASVFCLTPETWDDSLGYHLTAPMDFNRLHRWVDIHQDMYRFPLLVEAVLGQGLLVEGEQTATLINCSGAVVLCLLLWGWTARLGGATAAWLAVLALVASEQIGFHLGQTNEGFYSMAFAFMGVWAFGRAEAARDQVRWALLAGGGMALATCAKYTAIAPLVGIVAWWGLRLPGDPRRSIRALGALGAGFAVGGLAFLANGWLMTGNPVYPLIWGGLGWGSRNAEILLAFGCPGRDFVLGDIRSMLDALLRLVTVQQPLLLLALPCIPDAAFPGRRSFLVVWTAAFAVWAAQVPCLRLMMPGYPALALLAGLGLARWLAARASRGRVLLSAAVLVIAGIGGVHAIAAADFFKRSFMAAVGFEPAPSYSARILTSYWRAAHAVNSLVGPGERVLALGERRGYLMKPVILNRDPEDTPAMLEIVRASGDPRGIRRHLRQMGVTYLLLNYVTSEYLTGLHWDAFRWRPEELSRYWEFSRQFLSIVWSDPHPDGVNGGYVLYQVESIPHRPNRMIPFLPGAESAGVRYPGEDHNAYARRLAVLAEFAPGVVYYDARRAAVLLALGLPAEAVRIAERGIGSEYPEQAVLHGLRGAGMWKLGHTRHAIESLRAAAALKPGEPAFRSLLEQIEARPGPVRR